MWICKKCNFKNTTSSLNCHGRECDGKRDINAVEIPKVIQNEDNIETVEDYCPVCKKDQFFSKDSKKMLRWRWKCHGCKKLFNRKKDKKPKVKLNQDEPQN